MNPNEPSFHPSAQDTLRGLRERHPDTPFLALGQTALWDEPTKATVRSALDTFWPDARLIAATHDSDYFAKLPAGAGTAGPGAASAGGAKYVLVGHDDAKTRGLWSAAGEMSRLFGAEDVPTRHKLEQAGVRLALALHGAPDGFLSEVTGAWGWTGIVHAASGRRIAHDVPLADILPTLLTQIDQTLEGSAGCLEPGAPGEGRPVADLLRGWVRGFAERNPQASLSDLYRDLFPRLYDLLLGAPPANLATSNTLRLLRFNRQTAHLPRFAFVEAFLCPDTRQAAIDAYNQAVAGGETYALDRFGEGALPFDLVIPGRGRGTLHLKDDGDLLVDLDKPLTLPCPGGACASVADLAARFEDALGPDVALVGKAVTLIPMLAAEYLLVFHEGASAYTDRTERLVALLRAGNVPLPTLRPILRVRYHGWDALAAVPESVTFRLPAHLAEVFGRETIPAGEFAACWQCAVANAAQRLQQLAETRSPRALLRALQTQHADPDRWAERARIYEAAQLRLLGLWDRAQAIQGRVYTLYDQVRQLRREVAALEKAKGDDFRARVKPLRERLWLLLSDTPNNEAEAIQRQIEALNEDRILRFDIEIRQRHSQIRFALATVRDLKARRLTLERGPEAADARETVRRIEAEAERAKARLAANALRAQSGLPHTNFRPSAWWFPLVDPSGAWFRRLSETAEYYLEPLTPEA